jgi:predicted metalloprotease with PDZ domain
MKMKIVSSIVIFLLFTAVTIAQNTQSNIEVSIDLVQIYNDRVMVTAQPSEISSQTITYQLPRIIPGTYAIADYGRYVDEFSAFDKAGKPLPVKKIDINTWQISNAQELKKVAYLVNDTYDSETGSTFSGTDNTIFSPAGTNILEGKQFMLNMAGFVGYFENQKNIPYRVKISHPADLTGSSAMDDLDNSNTHDIFIAPRFADLIDSPVMYAAPDIATFTIENMNVVLHVYSPVKKEITAEALKPDLQKMMIAQKKFLGPINKTTKYAVLVYVTSTGKDDASGIGALEHNTSTTAVFMETMTSADLIHVISHEFFHTLTPLNVHSKEIHDFDFNDPKMSEHLWFYEGITEYFSLLFQVREGLISEDEFLTEMAIKEINAQKMYPTKVSFTEMSKNVLNPEMKKLYGNVYEKGALLAMCIDIIIREESDGKKGILDMMGQLAQMYGPAKPFDDSELIPVITEITNPAVGDFINKYIVKGDSISYIDFLSKAGVERATIQLPVEIALVVDNKPYMKIDQANKKVFVVVLDDKNEFINSMGLKNDDELIEMNGHVIDATDIVSIAMGMYKLEEGKPMVIKVLRNGQPVELKGNVKINRFDAPGYKIAGTQKNTLLESWLK